MSPSTQPFVTVEVVSGVRSLWPATGAESAAASLARPRACDTLSVSDALWFGSAVEAEAARSNRAGRMAQPSRFQMPEMPKSAPFVPRTLPPLSAEKSSRAQREREAKAYWDSLTEAQEVWALRKMGHFKIGGQPKVGAGSS
jgi:hypothetical protein